MAAVLVASPLAAQSIFQGNGVPSAYIETTPAILGQSFDIGLGSPSLPNGVAALSFSGGLGPSVAPLVGLIGLDLGHPIFVTQLVFLDGSGHAQLTFPLPPGVGSPADPPLFADAVSLEAGFTLSVSKTVRIDAVDPDSWEPAGNLQTPRQNHTATALGTGPRDNVTEVLICGGMTGSIIVPAPMASAELYDPRTRSTTPLPPMSIPRSGHEAVRLNDGRVLISGGVTTAGSVAATCEFFDPTTSSFSAAPSMSTPRAGHRMTLLNDGRVLCTGGVSSWQNAATLFIGVLNTAQDTAEIFDPSTNVWSALPTMSSRRLGHSQTLLADGRVLIVCGINGGNTGNNPSASPGQVPTYTSSCEVFDPAISTFAPTASLVRTLVDGPRAFHGASVLDNGDVLVTGGFIAQTSVINNGQAVPTNSCWRWDGSTWALAAGIPTPVAFHTQVRVPGGALVTGGFVGDLTALSTTGEHVFVDGTSFTVLQAAQNRAVHTMTPLADGTFLLYGGGIWPATRAEGEIYTFN